MSPGDWPSARVAGVDHVMWGSDYPHLEGTSPFTAESLRFTFAGIDRGDVRLVLGENAARVYGFDLDALGPLAAAFGPRVDDVATALLPSEFPDDAVTMALRGMPG
jgi:hypothetical protein